MERRYSLIDKKKQKIRITHNKKYQSFPGNRTSLVVAALGSSMGGRDGRLFWTPLLGGGIAGGAGEADDVDLEEMLDVRGGGTGLAVGFADLMQA